MTSQFVKNGLENVAAGEIGAFAKSEFIIKTVSSCFVCTKSKELSVTPFIEVEIVANQLFTVVSVSIVFGSLVLFPSEGRPYLMLGWYPA